MLARTILSAHTMGNEGRENNEEKDKEQESWYQILLMNMIAFWHSQMKNTYQVAKATNSNIYPCAREFLEYGEGIGHGTNSANDEGHYLEWQGVAYSSSGCNQSRMKMVLK